MLFSETRLRRLGVSNRPVIHCGANVGEELGLYQSLGLEPRMWIEANQDLATELVSNVHNNDLVVICCLGAISGLEVDFYVSNNLQSSSVLPLDKHREIYPDVDYSKTVKVRLETLDDQWSEEFGRGLLVLDLQGYELEALKGARSKVLGSVSMIASEIGIKDLYSGGAQLSEVKELLADYGFSLMVRRATQLGWGEVLFARKKDLTPIRRVLAFFYNLDYALRYRVNQLLRANKTRLSW